MFVTIKMPKTLEKCTFLSASESNRNILHDGKYVKKKCSRSRSNKKSPSEEGSLWQAVLSCGKLFYL